MNTLRIATILMDGIGHGHSWQVSLHDIATKEIGAWSREAQVAGWEVETKEQGNTRWTNLLHPDELGYITLFHAERPDA